MSDKIQFQNLQAVNDVPALKDSVGFTHAAKKYVIYAGPTSGNIWSEFLDQNFKDVNSLFMQYGYKFIYLPLYFFDPDNIKIKETQKDNIGYTQFNVPDNRAYFMCDYARLFTDEPLLTYITDDLLRYPALVYYHGYDADNFRFISYKLPVQNSKIINEQSFYLKTFDDFINGLNKIIANNDFASIETVEGIDGPTLRNLLKLDSAISSLRKIGLSRPIINTALQYFRHLSHLVITHDYRILLPFFEVEITLSPLPKALYFLYLKHPEGIPLKSMIDYRDELLQLYLMISPRENLDKIHKSIDRLCDPLDNSINEKCSRIREAFVKYFDDDLASIYYISGEAKDARYVLFDSDFIHWDVDWDMDEEEKIQYYIPIITTPQALQELITGKYLL